MHEIVHTIREVQLEDIPRLTQIMVQSFRSAFADFVSKETMDACTNEDNCYAMLRDIYQSGTMHFLIGDDAGMLVWQKGTGTDEFANASVEIVAVHSLPETIGSGLGSAMMTYALKQIQQLSGNVPVFLWAFRDNTRARRFYEKHGFQWDGSERVSEFDGAIEVRYVRKTNDMGQIQLQMIDHSVSSHWWREMISHFVQVGDALEIRCWKEETAEVKQASLYGTPVDDRYEVSIKGTVTADLLTELLSDEPADKSIYNKMTKYFTINVKNQRLDFCSAHYGTEMYIEGVTDDDITFFHKVIDPYGDCFSVYDTRC